MTREEVRHLIAQVIEAECPPDSEAVPMTSLQQLEFAFGIEEALEYRHSLPEDLTWTNVDDVVRWLNQIGELTDA